jgi:acetylornithine deacetylase/succinyl-diaminopimelate desuccinylase-like protein
MNATKLLSDFVSIQSVSTDKSRRKEILKAAEFLKKEIKSLEFKIKIYQKDSCSPLIIAKKIVSPYDKTIGIYAHYDVQPEDPVEQWDSPPFKLTARGGKLFGRGVADDKGHIIQTLIAIKQLITKGELVNNIVLIFEGEEEVGSQIFEYLTSLAKKDLEDIDVFYVLDMGMETSDQPEIFYGLKV